MKRMPPAPHDPERFAGLFQEHRDGLAGAVRGVLGSGADVTEVLQEAFLRVLNAARRGRLPAEPLGFLFVVTLNVARDLRRRRRRTVGPLEEATEMGLTANDPPPTERAEREEAVAAARAAIARLEDPEKDVFFLRVGAGLSFEQVAADLGIPVGTAKTRMRAALARLRKSLTAFSPTFEPGRDGR